MYIKKKPIVINASSNSKSNITSNSNNNKQKQKSLQNLLSIVQNTISIPKNYSTIYNHFFEILNKVITLQFKLIVNEKTEDNNPMPKYKKYLETKIASFFKSVRPITTFDKSSKKEASLSSCVNRNTSLNHEIAKQFRKISSNRFTQSEKTMNKSNSSEHSIGFSSQFNSSKRFKTAINSYCDRYIEENNKAGAVALSKSTIDAHSNYIDRPIQYQDYSVTSPINKDTKHSLYYSCSKSSGKNFKDKSILRTHSQANIRKAKPIVTFKDISSDIEQLQSPSLVKYY